MIRDAHGVRLHSTYVDEQGVTRGVFLSISNEDLANAVISYEGRNQKFAGFTVRMGSPEHETVIDDAEMKAFLPLLMRRWEWLHDIIGQVVWETRN